LKSYPVIEKLIPFLTSTVKRLSSSRLTMLITLGTENVEGLASLY
jgi:hypothetical protein